MSQIVLTIVACDSVNGNVSLIEMVLRMVRILAKFYHVVECISAKIVQTYIRVAIIMKHSLKISSGHIHKEHKSDRLTQLDISTALLGYLRGS